MTRKVDQIVDIGWFANREVVMAYVLDYCYCSVYGKCWYVKDFQDTEPSSDCEFRADIR
ncbi:MAG: hypothetical protein AAGJ82_12600 [Bacteroidota bacterium]